MNNTSKLLQKCGFERRSFTQCCDISTFLFYDSDRASSFSRSVRVYDSSDIYIIEIRLFSNKTILQFDAGNKQQRDATQHIHPHFVQGAAACPSMHWETDRHISSWASRPVAALWEETQTIKSTVKSTESPADSLLYIPAALRSLTLVFGRLRNILGGLTDTVIHVDKLGLLIVYNSQRTSTHPSMKMWFHVSWIFADGCAHKEQTQLPSRCQEPEVFCF